MNSRIMILMLTGLLCAPAGAVEIEGVKLADTATVAGRDLVLNGAGLRKKLHHRCLRRLALSPGQGLGSRRGPGRRAASRRDTHAARGQCR